MNSKREWFLMKIWMIFAELFLNLTNTQVL